MEPAPKGSSSGIMCPESLALTGVGLARKPEHECGGCVAASLMYLLCCCRMVQIKLQHTSMVGPGDCRQHCCGRRTKRSVHPNARHRCPHPQSQHKVQPHEGRRQKRHSRCGIPGCRLCVSAAREAKERPPADCKQSNDLPQPSTVNNANRPTVRNPEAVLPAIMNFPKLVDP